MLNFLVYVTIPVALQNTGIILSFGSVVIYVVAIAGLAREEKFFWEQVSEDCFAPIHTTLQWIFDTHDI